MNQNICFNCGGKIENVNGLSVCRSCGAVMPECVSEKEDQMLSSAFALLRESQFDDAKAAFEEIIRQYPYHPEGYWGRLRTRYHITYITAADEKSIPRCPTRSGANLADDVDYQSAILYADEDLRAFLSQQEQSIKALCTATHSQSKNITHQFTMGEVDANDATVIPPRKVRKKDCLVSLLLIFSTLFATQGVSNVLTTLVPVRQYMPGFVDMYSDGDTVFTESGNGILVNNFVGSFTEPRAIVFSESHIKHWKFDPPAVLTLSKGLDEIYDEDEDED